MGTEVNSVNDDQFDIIRVAIESHSNQILSSNGQLQDQSGLRLKEFDEDQDQYLCGVVEDALSLNNRPCIYLNFSKNNDLTHLDFLRYCRGIKGIKLEFCEALKSIDGVKWVSGLQDLSLYGCRALEKIFELTELHQLHTLDLSLCNSLIDIDLHAMSSLYELKRVRVNGVNAVEDFEFVKFLPKLTCLCAIDCYHLENLECLQFVTSLTTLSISGSKLSDLSPLGKMKDLDGLHIENLCNLTHLNDLAGAWNLKSLFVLDCINLQDISVVDKLPSLETVHIY